LELGLARQVLDGGTTLLAICRGVQVLNVAAGGTLHPHLPDVEGLATHADAELEPSHAVRARPDSLLATACGTRLASCPSQHHQGLDRLGQGLVATGWADDGLVEAVEVAGGGAWAVGVQWHPERAAAADPAQQALFDAFVAAAARAAGTAGAGGAGTAGPRPAEGGPGRGA
jgi:putative glutamine amidotransferase